MTAPRPSWMAPGRSRVSTFIVAEDAAAVVDFAKAVFGAAELRPPTRRADGSLWNVELDIGGSTVMVSQGGPEMARPAFLYVHVEDAAATFEAAKRAGASEIMPPERRFYGDVDGGVADSAGNWWWISTHVEDLTDAQIADAARAEEARRTAP